MRQQPIPMQQREQQKHDRFEQFALEIRPHFIGIAKAVCRAAGMPMQARCPHCGTKFALDEADKSA